MAQIKFQIVQQIGCVDAADAAVVLGLAMSALHEAQERTKRSKNPILFPFSFLFFGGLCHTNCQYSYCFSVFVSSSLSIQEKLKLFKGKKLQFTASFIPSLTSSKDLVPRVV